MCVQIRAREMGISNTHNYKTPASEMVMSFYNTLSFTSCERGNNLTNQQKNELKRSHGQKSAEPSRVTTYLALPSVSNKLSAPAQNSSEDDNRSTRP